MTTMPQLTTAHSRTEVPIAGNARKVRGSAGNKLTYSCAEADVQTFSRVSSDTKLHSNVYLA